MSVSWLHIVEELPTNQRKERKEKRGKGLQNRFRLAGWSWFLFLFVFLLGWFIFISRPPPASDVRPPAEGVSC